MSVNEKESALLKAMYDTMRQFNAALTAVADAGFTFTVDTYQPTIISYEKLRVPSPQVQIGKITRVEEISPLPYLLP